MTTSRSSRQGEGAEAGSDEGSPEAGPPRFETVFADHFPLVWRLLAYLGVPSSDLEDEVQNVFVVCLRNLPRYDPGRGSVRAWLSGIAVRVASEHRRRAFRRRERVSDSIEISSRDRDPERAAELRQAWVQVEAAVATMPAEQQEVFVLSEIEDVPMREIAEALGVSINTVGSRLRLARARFASAVTASTREEKRR